jgi:signal transduction histidine kinase
MISSRLAFTDLELNPASVTLQLTLRAGLYKKFQKAHHVLALKARLRRVPIRFTGNSYLEIDALPSFELVPFVILDNAIKYSPADQEIRVKFDENLPGNRLVIDVSSTGPIVEPDELSAIFDRGVRGRNASKLSVGGDGLGLFLAKFLCDYHGIDVSASSGRESQFSINGVPYGLFHVRLNVSL